MNRLGVSFSWRDKSLADIVSCSRSAEDAGVESVWISEAWGRDAFLALAAIAAATKRIKCATGIVNVYSRSPATIATSTATLDELSNGRAILGVGSSGALVIERWHGLRYDQPFARIRETTAIVRQILAGGQLRFQGDIFHVSDFRLAVPPPSHKIPIYLAALGPKMLKLAGRIADGVLLYLCPLPKIADAVAEVRKGTAKAKNQSEKVDVAAFLPTVVSQSQEKAQQAIAAAIAYYVGGMGTYYHRIVSESGFETQANRIRAAWQSGDRAGAITAVSAELVDSIGLAGPPDQCKRKLEEFRKAGIDLPILSFYMPNNESAEIARESIKALAAE